MKNSSLLFLLWIALMPSNLFAQENDPEAEAILKKVSQKYEAQRNLKADFEFVLESRVDDLKEVNEGTLHMQGDKFHITLGEYELICDGKSMWTFSKEDNMVEVNDYIPEEEEIDPRQIFKMHEEGFLYVHLGDKAHNGKTVQVIEMTPIEKEEKSFFKVRLLIDKASSEIVESKVFEKQGMIYTYRIKSQQSNIDMPNSKFTFDSSKHPDVDVLDLR